MKKRVKIEPLLNALARTVGHAAGTIAKATQELTADAAAIVKAKTDTAQRKPSPNLRRRTPKKKSKAAKSVTRQSRKRPSRA
jgi:hypothetical protein